MKIWAHRLLLLTALFFAGEIGAQMQIDSARYKHAIQGKRIRKVKELSDFLAQGSASESKTVETFVYWLAQNIVYDKDLQFRDDATQWDVKPEVTMMNRKSICAGYANLFRALCMAQGIQCETVSGFSLHYKGEAPGLHPWNAVKIAGEWRLVDPTWASGAFVNGKYRKGPRMHCVFTDPKDYIVDHFPKDEKWQLLQDPMTFDDFVEGCVNDMRRERKKPKTD